MKLSCKDQRDLDGPLVKIEARENEQAVTNKERADGAISYKEPKGAWALPKRTDEMNKLLAAEMERWELLAS